MAAQKGLSYIIQIDGTTVAGLRSTSFSINQETVDVTSKDSTNGARELLLNGGVRSFSISGSGVLTDGAVFDTIEGLMDGTAASFPEMTIDIPGYGDFVGDFQITSFEVAGEYNGEVTYSLSLESSGDYTFTAEA